MGLRDASERACQLVRSAGLPLKGAYFDWRTALRAHSSGHRRAYSLKLMIEKRETAGNCNLFANSRNSVTSRPMVSGWMLEA
jgi:hypothetical protein